MYGSDIFTEPEPDPDTLKNLGPLAPLAGVWEGLNGVDEHPVLGGVEGNSYCERYELQPIDAQTNGPQLFYGLRYHIHIVKPGEIEAFHDQVGYWLWEPQAKRVILTMAIPRAQVMMATGQAEPDADEFELRASLGSEHFSIMSNPFLDRAFQTVGFTMVVRINENGTWSYEEEALLQVEGREDLFRHTDRNTLTKIAPPTPNPLAAAETS